MFPVKSLQGNLGDRHRHLNHAVKDAFKNNMDFENLKKLPESSPIDRIFKIKLASKLQNVDYIMKNLQDDDMLYVSKALQSKWLFEDKYQNIINPEYLEEKLYPTMLTTAIAKMKHWIYINLKDTERCQKFYIYYCCKNFTYAMKFLKFCPSDFILEQFTKNMLKITPRDLKILSEKQPKVVKVFFDSLITDKMINKLYFSKEKQYFDVLRYVLRTNPTMVLDLTEKYFNEYHTDKFSARSTKYVMKHCRKRFLQKPELYTSMVLSYKTLANCLNSSDAIDLINTIVRDQHLTCQGWANYKKLEPLIQRLDPKDRGQLKKKLFVDKDIGPIVEKWLYERPNIPDMSWSDVETESSTIFCDKYHDPDQFDRSSISMIERFLKKKKKKCKRFVKKENTLLDKLFNEFRVASFAKTLFELQKKLKAESSLTYRQYMMLVLVSKAGGHEDNIVSLLRFLSSHKNEQSHVRATVVRSLVKRANIWRVSEEIWNNFMEFTHGLGLDGKESEAGCVEGIHAIVIRQLLRDRNCDKEIFTLYLQHFSTFKEYQLSNSEQVIIANALSSILFSKVLNETDISSAANILDKLLEVLKAFCRDIDAYPKLIDTINKLAKDNIDDFSDILRKLYRSKIARKKLYNVNFELFQTEASYINALRHDIKIICPIKLRNLLKEHNKNFNRFFQKVSIYFNEENGLVQKLLQPLTSEDNKMYFSKLLCILSGHNIFAYLEDEHISVNNLEDNKEKAFAASLRANIHFVRPKVDLDIFDTKLGTKALANKILICRQIDVKSYTNKLLEHKQTTRLAFALSKRTDNRLDSFIVYSKVKPNACMKLGLKIIEQENKLSKFDHDIWNVTKPLLKNYKISWNYKDFLQLPKVNKMPTQIQAEYSVCLFRIFRRHDFLDSMQYLCYMENLLQVIELDVIEDLIMEFLTEGLPDDENICYRRFNMNDCLSLYIRIIIKYMLLSKSEEEEVMRLNKIGKPFFAKMDIWMQERKFIQDGVNFLAAILQSFRYFKAFLNDTYVSCIPVMAMALEWMKRHFPIETHLKYFVHMHLNMLYYRALKDSLDALPNKCIDSNTENEARVLVGRTFGKYLGTELDTLKMYFFDSIQYLYKDILMELNHIFHSGEKIFTQSFVSSLLDQSANTNTILAVYLFKMYGFLFDVEIKNDILNKIRASSYVEVQMIFLSDF